MTFKPTANRTTLMDLARDTGLSHMTVQRALMGSAAVRPETREIVLEAAGRLGYRPNASARAMRNGRFNHIALLTSTNWERANLSGHLIQGIDEVLAEQDLHLVFARLTDDALTSGEEMPRIVQQSMIDGLLIKYDNHVPQRMIDHLQRFQIPHIWINVARDVDCVRPDDLGVARAATERLISLGHRHISYFDFSYDPDDAGEHYSSRYRYDGYVHAMQAAGLTVRARRLRTGLAAQRNALISEEFSPNTRPTAVVLYGSESLLWFVHQEAARLGLGLGRDIQVITLDGNMPDYLGLALPHYAVDQVELGRQAARALLRKLEAPTKPLPTVLVPFTWIEKGPALAPPL